MQLTQWTRHPMMLMMTTMHRRSSLDRFAPNFTQVQGLPKRNKHLFYRIYLSAHVTHFGDRLSGIDGQCRNDGVAAASSDGGPTGGRGPRQF